MRRYLAVTLMMLAAGCGDPTPVGLRARTAQIPRDGGWDKRIYDVAAGVEISRATLADALGAASLVVLGEKHYTEAVQAAEAFVISDAVAAGAHEGAFVLGWEFLSRRDQAAVDRLYERVLLGGMTAEEFAVETQQSSAARSYGPVIAAAASLGGGLSAVNLAREEKAPVVAGGIAAADPTLVPDGYEPGSAAYRDRFTVAMQDHVPPDKLSNYFDAQCLTDDVMAHTLLGSREPFKILVAGSFHTDYRDGAVARLAARAPSETVAAVRIVDASDYREPELPSVLWDERYGPVADFVVFVNEPVAR